MCPVDASKEDKTNIRSTNERVNCLYRQDNQLNQEERGSAPCDVTKIDRYR